MTDTGCNLHNLAMRSCAVATGTPTTGQACSTSTTIGRRTTTTTLASADPSIQHLDGSQQATEGHFLVDSIQQTSAKARNGLIKPKAKPKTAAEPTGAAVEHGKNEYPPYRADVYRAYFAVIHHLGIYDECVQPCPINTGGTKDTDKGALLHWAIYNAIVDGNKVVADQ